MKRVSLLSILLMLSLSLATTAQQTPIDLSAFANTGWCTAPSPYFLNCTTFPFGTHKYNGVTFNIAGTSNTTNNAWVASTAAGGGSGQVSITIPVNVPNVRTVYTLMNTYWGSTATGLLTVTFAGTNGASWTYNPISLVEIRDYNQDGYTNSIACRLPGGPQKAATINAWNNNEGQRLDMQTFELPVSFKGQTLTSITITDNGDENVQRVILAAITVSTNAP